MRDLTKAVLDALELLAALSGIALLALAALSLLLATFRVAVRGRVFALPFSGNDERRVELTKLFVRRLTAIEQEWIALAAAVEKVRNEVNAPQRRCRPAHQKRPRRWRAAPRSQIFASRISR